MSTANALRCSSKIVSTRVICQELLAHKATLTPSSSNLTGTRDEVLKALAKDIEIHIRNDGFRRGIEMYFASLIKRSLLISELVSIENNTEVQANLDVAETEKKNLMDKLSKFVIR